MPDIPPALHGIVNVLRPAKIRGWAVAPGFPDQHVLIEAWLDEVLIGTAVASASLGPPRGNHGFVIDLRHDLPSDALKRLEVWAIPVEGARIRLGLSSALSALGSGAPPAAEVEMGRDRVPEDLDAGRPVFVLGSARSGTTAMTQALRSCAKYEGYGEGHLFTLLPKLLQTTQGHYAGRVRERAPGINTMLANMPQPAMEQVLRQAFVDVARGLFKTGRWLEKTPGPDMIRAAPQMLIAWPRARFIFMKRHPIANIVSRLRKFPTVRFDDHCRLWAECMIGWEKARPTLSDSAVDIDQMQLVEQPEAAVAAVGDLLGLEDAQRAAMLSFFTSRHPERTAKSYEVTTDPRAVGWTDAQIDVFHAVCGPVMARFGYEAAV